MVGDAFDCAVGGIRGRRQDKENFVVAVIEFRQRGEVAIQPWFHALARAEQRHARRIEARIALHSAAHISKPAQAVPDEVHTHTYLDNGQVVEQCLHVNSRVAEPFRSRRLA
jgi:hypothetical protein